MSGRANATRCFSPPLHREEGMSRVNPVSGSTNAACRISPQLRQGGVVKRMQPTDCHPGMLSTDARCRGGQGVMQAGDACKQNASSNSQMHSLQADITNFCPYLKRRSRLTKCQA